MNLRTEALKNLNALRAENARLPDTVGQGSTQAVWEDLAASYPHGADVAVDVVRMVGSMISAIDRALVDPFTVRLDRENAVVTGLIVCPDANSTKIVPLTTRESVVVLSGVPYFVGRARGREALRLALLGCVIGLIENADD